MKRKLIVMSVGYILILSACGSNNVSSGNEDEFSGTWELIDEDVSGEGGCPTTIRFTGKDKMVWMTGESTTIESKYTRVFEDDFKVKPTAAKIDGETQEISGDEEETTNIKMKKDDDRLRLEYQGESCTYSLK
ncbi:hypothetical protein [Priestia aryabhattai]|uniref:hypothetical protein n=1 Tax=Priestia aryabhattai TaxID=412384 RepID=UPI001ADACEA8|nr:hypothetical protein [Priestia aryabhattai]QTL52643.1 hypothetical protein J5Z55_29035 [Priestia aryabhattai]